MKSKFISYNAIGIQRIGNKEKHIIYLTITNKYRLKIKTIENSESQYVSFIIEREFDSINEAIAASFEYESKIQRFFA